MGHNKVSKEEQLLCERIFCLQISLRILRQGRCPFTKEAIKMIEDKIKELKK
jgi:hypothetical protein